MLDPRARPALQLPALLASLAGHGVDWVLSGSLVLAVYGARITPRDLDVVPDPDPANLNRLAALLRETDAIPAHFPHWPGSLSEQECREWIPDPAEPAGFDHLFVTRLGLLDVPIELTGTHAHLRARARRLRLHGTDVWVSDPDEVLARLPARPRAKDRERATAYAALRERLRTDRTPRGTAVTGPVTDPTD